MYGIVKVVYYSVVYCLRVAKTILINNPLIYIGQKTGLSRGKTKNNFCHTNAMEISVDEVQKGVALLRQAWGNEKAGLPSVNSLFFPEALEEASLEAVAIKTLDKSVYYKSFFNWSGMYITFEKNKVSVTRGVFSYLHNGGLEETAEIHGVTEDEILESADLIREILEEITKPVEVDLERFM